MWKWRFAADANDAIMAADIVCCRRLLLNRENEVTRLPYVGVFFLYHKSVWTIEKTIFIREE
jgi:hypothetical protein